MKQTIGILLIIFGLVLGIFGISKLTDRQGSIEVDPPEVITERSSARTEAYVMMGGGILVLILGTRLLVRNKK